MTRLTVRVLLLCSVLPARASGQEPPDEWKAGVELGLNATRGNSYITLFSTAIQITRLETAKFELNWNASALYGENADSVIARRYRTAVNFDWRPDARVSPFVFADVERDRFRRLLVRTNAGVGAKYVVWRGAGTEGSISTAVLHDYQRFTRTVADAPASTSDARWSVRTKARREFDSGVVLENTTFFKPVFDRFDDYDLDTATKASLKMSDRVAITLSWALRYDATPPLNVRKDDQVLQIGLSLDL